MAKTDRQTDKTSRWQFTAYEEQYGLVDDMSKSSTVAEYGYQPEICPETGRKHRQGYLRTKNQVRFSALRKEFPGIHFEVAKNWAALINYCKKEETRDKSEKSFSGTGGKEQPLTMAQALIKLCSYADPKPIMLEIPQSRVGLDGKEIALASKYEWNYEYDSRAQYISAVKNWLKVNPNIIALVTQPQYKSAYFDFWQDFQALAVETALHGPEGLDSAYSITAESAEEFVEPEEEDFSEYSFLD